jgi:hypothetical protein
VQLDNTPAEAAAERRPQHRPPPSVARPPLNTTWAWYVAALKLSGRLCRA